jgi:REP element-mobilizing transposase RayT
VCGFPEGRILMARPLRIEYEGAFYHVTSRGNERKRIFSNKWDYDRFKTYLKGAKEKYGCVFHSYVLMPNHYHLTIETPEGNLSKVMHYINGSYTNYFNHRKGRTGHLFQGRYKAILVDVDSYLLELSRYIHLNPVRAGMVERPEAYPHSSYKSFISRRGEEIVFRDLIWGMISRDRIGTKAYQAFVERGFHEELKNPLDNVYAGSILGGKSFVSEALDRLKQDVFSTEETSHRRALHRRHEAGEILAVVSEHFGIATNDLLEKKRDPRNLLIYLLRQQTGMTNREIGDFVGGLSYSGVTRAEERFAEKLKKNKKLQKDVKAVSQKMSNIKG